MNCPRCDFKLDRSCKECTRCNYKLPKNSVNIKKPKIKQNSKLFGFLNKETKAPVIEKKPEIDFSDVTSALQNHIKTEPKKTEQKKPSYLNSPFQATVAKTGTSEEPIIQTLEKQTDADLLKIEESPSVDVESQPEIPETIPALQENNDDFDSLLSLLDFGTDSSPVINMVNNIQVPPLVAPSTSEESKLALFDKEDLENVTPAPAKLYTREEEDTDLDSLLKELENN